MCVVYFCVVFFRVYSRNFQKNLSIIDLARQTRAVEDLLIGDSLGPTDGKVLGSNEGIKLGSTDGKVLGTIIANVDVITLGLDVRTKMGSLDGSFDCYNYGKLEGLFLVGSWVSTDDKVLGSDEGVWLSFSFARSLTSLVGFFRYGYVQCLLLCSKSIVAKKYFCDRH